MTTQGAQPPSRSGGGRSRHSAGRGLHGRDAAATGPLRLSIKEGQTGARRAQSRQHYGMKCENPSGCPLILSRHSPQAMHPHARAVCTSHRGCRQMDSGWFHRLGHPRMAFPPPPPLAPRADALPPPSPAGPGLAPSPPVRIPTPGILASPSHPRCRRPCFCSGIAFHRPRPPAPCYDAVGAAAGVCAAAPDSRRRGAAAVSRTASAALAGGTPPSPSGGRHPHPHAMRLAAGPPYPAAGVAARPRLPQLYLFSLPPAAAAGTADDG